MRWSGRLVVVRHGRRQQHLRLAARGHDTKPRYAGVHHPDRCIHDSNSRPFAPTGRKSRDPRSASATARSLNRRRLVMSAKAANPKRADYGIDAPGVIRNLFLAGVIGLSAWLVAVLAVWSGWVAVPKLILVVTGMGLTTGIGCSLMGL